MASLLAYIRVYADYRRRLTIENLGSGETFEDDADILVAARGTLNDIKWPVIPGLESFNGEIMHSAKWNQHYDFRKKKVGVIGGGSSSIQIVPQLQKIEGADVSVFVRSKTWISNPFGDHAMIKLGLDPKVLDCKNIFRLDFLQPLTVVQSQKSKRGILRKTQRLTLTFANLLSRTATPFTESHRQAQISRLKHSKNSRQ